MASRLYPALEIRFQTLPGPDRIDQLLAALDDDEGPTAVEERDSGLFVFFPDDERRDRALAITRSFAPDTSVCAVSISDEAWAERSQASIGAVRVGCIVVTPPWVRAAASSDDDVVITILPSMGFGTGHHASTRLCLRLVQQLDVRGRSVLDVGTGSGVLAIAAWRLGAARVVGIDVDPDALTNAGENVGLNGAAAVELAAVDLARGATHLNEQFDLVLANLTGAMFRRFGNELASLLSPGGSVIVSGFQADEQTEVFEALSAAGLTVDRRDEEDRWVAVCLSRRRTNLVG